MALTQLPFGVLPEPNPYRPDVPDSIRALDPELHDFLREMNDNLRRQHSATQAGDTTFSWQILTTLDDSPRYTVGSQGRFSHPDYGLMSARYVRYESVAEGLWSGAPVGLLNGSESPWVVTNQFRNSSPGNVVGLPGTYTSPKNGQYGWVITNGVNIQTLTSTAAAIPFVQMGWVGDDQVGPLKDTSSPLGSTLRHTNGEIGPGAFRVEVASNFLGAVFTDMRNRPTTETTFEDGLLRTITRLERDYANASFGLKIISEQLTRITENSVEVELNSYMQAFANFRNLADMASKNASKYATRGQVAAYAANESERRAAIYRNEIGFFAESINRTSVEVSLNEASARVSAGQAAEASLTAAGYAAQALEYVSLAATVGASINPNPVFAVQWAQDLDVPPLWFQAANDRQGITPFRGSPGRYGPYNYRVVREAGVANRNFYINQRFPAGRDNYLIHAEAFLDGPDWAGAGVLVRAHHPSQPFVDTFVNFRTAPRVDGTSGHNDEARIYSWALPVNVPEGTNEIELFTMPTWMGFTPDASSPLTVEFHRAELRVSVFADDSGAQAYTDARITEVNLAIANETEARTTQYTNARTEYVGLIDGIDGRVDGVTIAVAQANTRIDTVANAAGAAVSSVETLEASFNSRASNGGNLLSNTEFLTLDGWVVGTNPWGPAAYLGLNTTDAFWRPSATNTLNIGYNGPPQDSNSYFEVLSNPIQVDPDDWVQFYIYLASHRAPHWAALFFYDNLGGYVGYSGEGPGPRFDNGGNYSLSDYNRIGKQAFKIPTGVRSVRLCFRMYGSVPGSTDAVLWAAKPYVGFARPNQTEWNPYSPGSAGNVAIASNARAVNSIQLVSDAQGATATSLDSLRASYNQNVIDVDGRISGVVNSVAGFDGRITANANAIGSQVTRIDTLYAAFNREVDSGLQQYVTEVLNKANAAQGRADSAFTGAEQAYARGTEGVNNAAAAQGTANNAQDRITSVLGTLSGYDSRITANSDATSAQAGRIDTAYAALRGESDSGLKTLIGSVSVVAQSAVDAVNGVKVRYGVYLNADNTIGGFELLGGGGRISFTVRADDIAFMTDGGRKTPFAVSGSDIILTGAVKINGTLILNGTVYTDTIAANQVTNTVTIVEGFDTVSNGETKILATLNATVRNDSTIRIDVQYDSRLSRGTTGTARLFVQRVQNGFAVTVGRFMNLTASASSISFPTSFWFLDGPAAGPVTYDIVVSTDSGDRQYAFTSSQLMLQEFKR